MHKQGYQPCGCYVGKNAFVVIRCQKHGAADWTNGGKRIAPVTHPWGKPC